MRAIILDNEAVQALSHPDHAKHRVVVAHLAGATARRRRGATVQTVVPTAVRVEAGWDRSAGSAAAINRFRVVDAVLDTPDGKVLIAGDDAEVYDPVLRTWSDAGRPASFVRNLVLLQGERILGVAVDEYFLYDGNGSWSEGSCECNEGATVTLLTNGKALIAGGEEAGGQPSAAAVLVDYQAGQVTVTEADSMEVARRGHATVALNDNRALAVGGIGTGGPTRSAEVFTPPTG